MIQFRFPDILERIHRPFLYLALHLPEPNPILQLISPQVQKCLTACIKDAAKGSHRHRHHGTWYENRSIFAKSLLLLAAVKSRRVHVPEGWNEAVRKTIIGLRFWKREAPDLGKAAEILEKILHEINDDNFLS